MYHMVTLPVKDYIVKNEFTGKIYSNLSIDEAGDLLMQLRTENQHDEFIMYAVIEA